MSNRRASLPLQIATVAVLGGVWLLAKTLQKQKEAGNREGGYRLNPKLYSFLSLLLLAADIYAIPAVLRSKMLIDADELAAVNPKLIRHWQQKVLAYLPERRAWYQRLSDRVLMAVIALPLGLLASRQVRRDLPGIGILYLWVHAVTYTIYSFSPLGPALVDKYRPIVYYTDLPAEERNKGNNRNASYSGHTGNAACATFFGAKVYCDYHHEEMNNAVRYAVYGLALLPPLLVGWLRTKALKHFPSDVLQAVAIGGCCGAMIPQLYRTNS